ncbi:MAG: Na+/H+ antiporter subunit E [Deltaproteobacteria bacterium]|nr:Na+/H+ antiporter subunit E [Deltaproteobacteria bacterium]
MKAQAQGKALHHEPASESDPRPVPPNQGSTRPIFYHVLTFFLLFCLWVILSGKFDLFHLSLGVISCLIVTLFSKDLLFPEPSAAGSFQTWIRFPRYIPWLLYQIFMANLHVLYLVFHPRMMDLIDPQIIRFQSRLKGDLALLTFANSITLTPGTITVYVSINGAFTVHALDKQSREGIPGEMEKRIARVFGEE